MTDTKEKAHGLNINGRKKKTFLQGTLELWLFIWMQQDFTHY